MQIGIVLLLVVLLGGVGIVTHLMSILKNDTKKYTPYNEDEHALDDLDDNEHYQHIVEHIDDFEQRKSKEVKQVKQSSVRISEEVTDELYEHSKTTGANPLSLDGA